MTDSIYLDLGKRLWKSHEALGKVATAGFGLITLLAAAWNYYERQRLGEALAIILGAALFLVALTLVLAIQEIRSLKTRHSKAVSDKPVVLFLQELKQSGERHQRDVGYIAQLPKSTGDSEAKKSLVEAWEWVTEADTTIRTRLGYPAYDKFTGVQGTTVALKGKGPDLAECLAIRLQHLQNLIKENGYDGVRILRSDDKYYDAFGNEADQPRY